MDRRLRTTRRYRRLMQGGVIVAVLVLAGLILPSLLIRPPLESLRLAYETINWARSSHAAEYLPHMLAEAESLVEAGEAEITRINSQRLRLATYTLADSLLREAIQLAGICGDSATELRLEAHRLVQEQFAEQLDKLAAWQQILAEDLIRRDCRSLVESAAASLAHADALLQHGLLVDARQCIEDADSVLAVLAVKQSRYSERVAQRHQLSQGWLEETFNTASTTGEPVLVVDKAAHQVMVLFGAKVVKSYPCDLGFNAAYQKRHAGDGATPEGKYKVVEVRSNSKYYRALLLDYPNEEDRARFRQNLRQGAIDSKARIGGLIEIHGDGGLGFDWTDGCVAVSNQAMDALLQYAQVGTTVTIVRDSGLSR